MGIFLHQLLGVCIMQGRSCCQSCNVATCVAGGKPMNTGSILAYAISHDQNDVVSRALIKGQISKDYSHLTFPRRLCPPPNYGNSLDTPLSEWRSLHRINSHLAYRRLKSCQIASWQGRENLVYSPPPEAICSFLPTIRGFSAGLPSYEQLEQVVHRLLVSTARSLADASALISRHVGQCRFFRLGVGLLLRDGWLRFVPCFH